MTATAQIGLVLFLNRVSSRRTDPPGRLGGLAAPIPTQKPKIFRITKTMEQCPICFSELEIRVCAPCDDCGWNVPTEIEHLNKNMHTYATYEIYPGLRLTSVRWTLDHTNQNTWGLKIKNELD